MAFRTPFSLDSTCFSSCWTSSILRWIAAFPNTFCGPIYAGLPGTNIEPGPLNQSRTLNLDDTVAADVAVDTPVWQRSSRVFADSATFRRSHAEHLRSIRGSHCCGNRFYYHYRTFQRHRIFSNPLSCQSSLQRQRQGSPVSLGG